MKKRGKFTSFNKVYIQTVKYLKRNNKLLTNEEMLKTMEFIGFVEHFKLVAPSFLA